MPGKRNDDENTNLIVKRNSRLKNVKTKEVKKYYPVGNIAKNKQSEGVRFVNSALKIQFNFTLFQEINAL